jgi:hypothetical protein
VLLESHYFSDFSILGNRELDNYDLVEVVNTMNSHFGDFKVRHRNGRIAEFILVFPKKLKLPWYLKAEVKRDRLQLKSDTRSLSPQHRTLL